MFSWLRAGLSRLSFGGTQGVALVANWLAGILWTFESTFLNLTRQGYRGNEVVYACLRLLSTSTPEPPLMAYTEDDKGEREALKKTHPLVSLIRHPNELMTEYEFWELATLHLAIVGRSTWWKERDRRGVPIALWPLRPDRIGPVYSDSSKAGEKVLRGWAYQIPGQGSVIELHRRDVLSFNFPDPAGESGGIIEGLGPLAALAKQVASDNEATNFVGALLANYAAPTVVLKVKQAIRSEAEAKLKKAAFRAEFGGARRGTPAIIDGDATIETVGFNLRELEFPEIREIAETRIAATLGVPAGLVGLRAGLKLGADRSNFAESREFFAETTLANYWRRFQDQYMLDVAAEFGEDIVCEFDTTKVKALAAQFVAQVQPIKDAFKDGAATVNEYREALKLDPIPDGDVRILPAQVQQIPVGGVKEEPPKQLPPGAAQALPEGGEEESAEEPLEGEDTKFTKHLIDDASDASKSSLKAVAPRDRHERELQAALVTVFEKFAPDIAAQIARGEMPDTAALEAALRDAIEVKLIEAATDEGVRIGEEIAVQYDPAVINEAAVQFAKTYTYDLVKGLTDTTRKTLQNAMTKYQATPGMTIGDLQKLLSPAFGEVRASKIAVTEVTRSYSAGMSIMQDMLAADGIVMQKIWLTSNDEIVRQCPVCWPNHLKPENEWQRVPKTGPPAHVFCRCSVALQAVPESEAKSATLPDDDAAMLASWWGEVKQPQLADNQRCE